MDVYVIYDPLFEKVLCVHDSPDMMCDDCAKIMKEREEKNLDNLYLITEKKFRVKTEKEDK